MMWGEVHLVAAGTQQVWVLVGRATTKVRPRPLDNKTFAFAPLLPLPISEGDSRGCQKSKHRGMPDRRLPPVIPAKAGHSRDGTSIQRAGD